MRALVIGGTGFVGLNVIDALLAAGASVRISRRKQTATVLLRGRNVELAEASLEEPEKLRRAMTGCDVVFLTGAYYPRYSLDLEGSLAQGVTGVRHACEAALAAGIPRLVYTSTIATLSPAPSGRAADENDRYSEIPEGSVYRGVKWAMEREVERFRERGLNAVTLLPSGCIGPWDVRLGTGSIIVGVVRGMLPWWVDGTINLVDVRDVARAHVAAAGQTPSDRYCIAGHTVGVGWLLQHIAARYGGTAPTLELSADNARRRAEEDERAAAPLRQRVPIPRELVDMATTGQRVSDHRARAELGLEITPLDQALDSAHAWFTKYAYIPRANGEPRSHEHP